MVICVYRQLRDRRVVGLFQIRSDVRLRVGSTITFAGTRCRVAAGGYEGLWPCPVVHLARLDEAEVEKCH